MIGVLVVTRILVSAGRVGSGIIKKITLVVAPVVSTSLTATSTVHVTYENMFRFHEKVIIVMQICLCL